MDKEEQSDARRREASRAGLIAGLLLLTLLGVALFVGASLVIALKGGL
jgi:hypothetical protein